MPNEDQDKKPKKELFGVVPETNTYGPSNPGFDNGLDRFGTFDYLAGYANKIREDLIRVAKCYNGRKIRVFRPKETERCPYCTNRITGEIMKTRCKYCKGTGHVGGWDILCECWAYGNIGPKQHIATPRGLSEAEGNNRDTFIVVGCTKLLQDQDFFIFKGNRDCYKVYDSEPFMAAMRGTVIAQVVQAAGLTPGNLEFNETTWEEDGE